MKNKIKTFWLTNTSNMNVSLSDLNLTIKAYSTINLLDNKHYKYTEDQLIKSAESGSIFKKSNRLSVRKINPKIFETKMLFVQDAVIPYREKSIFNIKEENYEELNISDEEFARDNADIIELDSKPIKRS